MIEVEEAAYRGAVKRRDSECPPEFVSLGIDCVAEVAQQGYGGS